MFRRKKGIANVVSCVCVLLLLWCFPLLSILTKYGGVSVIYTPTSESAVVLVEECRHCNNFPSGMEWESFKSMVEILNAVGANYSLASGTVLGWYRDCSLAGQKDLDFNLEFTWFMDNREKLHAALVEYGWHQLATYGKLGHIGYEEAWKKDGSLKVDLNSQAYVNGEYINGITLRGTTYPCYSSMDSRPIHTWHFISFPVPAPIEAYLAEQYSTTWKVKKNEIWDVAPFETENGRRECEKREMPEL